MSRKKWTPKTEVTDSLLKFREKRKWQIALRRYVLEQRWSTSYAPYFGLEMGKFRTWIALQFEGEMRWDNFSLVWQFDHVVPVAYFDFGLESELRLCWNFTNIRVAPLGPGEGRSSDILSAKSYFKTLHEKTGYPLCVDMVQKLEGLEATPKLGPLEGFLREQSAHLRVIATFSDYEYLQLNEGVSIDKILEERGFSDKIGNVPS